MIRVERLKVVAVDHQAALIDSLAGRVEMTKTAQLIVTAVLAPYSAVATNSPAIDVNTSMTAVTSRGPRSEAVTPLNGADGRGEMTAGSREIKLRGRQELSGGAVEYELFVS